MFLISSIHFIAKYNISLLHYLENNGQIFISESTVLPALWTSMFDGLLKEDTIRTELIGVVKWQFKLIL